VTRFIRAAILILALSLAGCSGGGANDQSAQQVSSSEPSVSTPPDETATPATTGDFDTAVKFTKLAHTNKYKEAAELVVPESPADRYVVHQTLYRRAMKTSQGYAPEDVPPEFEPDPGKGSIKIIFLAEAETQQEARENATSYTWKDFTYEGGKIAGWTGKSGPVKDLLWTRTTHAESRGRRAELKSAYLSNIGSLIAVVELWSSQPSQFWEGEYTARGGYRQAASEYGARDLSEGEKTLGYYVFEDAKFGGVLHIPYTDGDGSSQGDWNLKLAIK
jgi:hypothetical protein